jgi:hypothetical protein
MSRRKYIWASVAALAVIAVLVYLYGGSQTPAGQTPLARLTTQSLPQLETAFNAAKSDVRLLVLLSPT